MSDDAEDVWKTEKSFLIERLSRIIFDRAQKIRLQDPLIENSTESTAHGPAFGNSPARLQSATDSEVGQMIEN